MKRILTDAAWYKGLVERCKSEPDRVHTALIENGHLGREEFMELLDDLSSQLGDLPKNARILVNLDGMITDLSKYKLLERPIINNLGINESIKDWGDKFERTDLTQKLIDDIDKELKGKEERVVRNVASRPNDLPETIMFDEASMIPSLGQGVLEIPNQLKDRFKKIDLSSVPVENEELKRSVHAMGEQLEQMRKFRTASDSGETPIIK
jgi:hypothetical protein